MSTGPCQAAKAYQSTKRWPPGPAQKTNCWEPSLATATAGVEVSVPSWGKPTGPCQAPRAYQASASWLVVVSFQKTSCCDPSGVTATWGAPTLCGAKCGGGGGDDGHDALDAPAGAAAAAPAVPAEGTRVTARQQRASRRIIVRRRPPRLSTRPL